MSKITDKINDDFKFDIIPCAPAYSLSECLGSTARRKRSVFERDEIDGLTETTKENFRTAVFMIDQKQRDFLTFAAQMTEKKEPLSELLEHQPFGVFAENDFLFLYLHDDRVYLVMPEELIDVYRAATAEETFDEKNECNLRLYSYACALLNIYGMYEIERLVAVWNQHNKGKIDYERAETFLTDRMNFRSDYWIEDGFVISDGIFFDEFEELYNEVCDMEYYTPTKTVIRNYENRYYSDDEYKVPGQREMEDFLSEYIKDEVKLDNLQVAVELSCERLEPYIELAIKDELETAGAPLHNVEFCEKFNALYNKMRDNSRIWELRGFTPQEYRMNTDNQVKPFKLPKSAPKKAAAKKKKKRK